MGLSFLLPLLLRLCLRIGGEDLRDDPVQIVKEGRPLPQDAAEMIPNVNVVGIDLVPLFRTHQLTVR